jgi:hypothetical protein
MNTKRILSLAVGLLALGFTSDLRAEDAAKPSADLKAKLEELRALPPEERRVKQREFMQSLTPEQRQEIRQLREGAAAKNPGATADTLKKRAAERIAALEKKKADGTITEQETKQLAQMLKRQEALKAGKPAAEKPTKAKAKAGKKKADKEAPKP